MGQSLFNAVIVISSCVSATTIAGDSGGPRPAFPATDADFGLLRNWFTKAQPPECEAFLQEASEICEQKESPAAKPQLAILRAITLENQTLLRVDRAKRAAREKGTRKLPETGGGLSGFVGYGLWRVYRFFPALGG